MKSKYIIFVPSKEVEYLPAIKYSFGEENIELIDSSFINTKLQEIADKINNNYSKVFFFGFEYKFYLLLPMLSKKIETNWILKEGISEFANTDVYSLFNQIIEYYNRNLINKIYLLNKDLYEVLKNKYNVEYLLLDINTVKENKKNNTIGIMGNDFDSYANVYNQLSGITLSKLNKVKILNAMVVTDQFGKDFDLNIIKCNTLEELLLGNKVNLYCNFVNINKTLVLYSMDNGIPCILGNTDMFDKCPILKKYLVLEQDDSVDEIGNKINLALANKDEIIKEYSVFRKKYTKEYNDIISNVIKK